MGRGLGHWDTCVGTVPGVQDQGLGDIKYGMQGHVGRGLGMSNVGTRGCFFVKMCYLWSTLDSIVQSHIGHLMVFT